MEKRNNKRKIIPMRQIKSTIETLDLGRFYVFLVNIDILFSILHDFKGNLIFVLNKFDLKLELFLTDPFRATVELDLSLYLCNIKA